MHSAYVPQHASPYRSAARYIIRVSGYSSDWNTFGAREHPEACTPMLAQQFKHAIWHAIVCLSKTGDCGLNPCFCSRQAKSEEMWNWRGKDIHRTTSRKFHGSLKDLILICFFESEEYKFHRVTKPALSHRASCEESRMLSLEPVVEKAIGFCFHVIREAMPSREKDGPKPFTHSFLRIVVLRFLQQRPHSIDGEEGISFSRRQQKGTWSQRSHQRIQITDL